ncbi:dTDP-4-dehydrorhamnose 3,5-epimerase [Skermanella stibiiresistens SB22]|uniref:dTDP-4-dehydrorhamnose 3,5-epimerase n=1 Tax=Skermanella stibiiresistens SB22 TaxID=1385369 RepID=W9H8Z4_9PROT|nr:dTDP-4-dehydrorhamnose 3,5-epimerase [Skermanella stibiiresistens]EWY42529.1 dTDP-4-dehydrorhamnose 3,5-epimerase [Skermanella stibiiresistens SB22]
MRITDLDITDVKMIVPKKFGDARGYFCETYSKQDFAEAGIEEVFVQDNQSFSASHGTVRGLHFQVPPFAQSKLVRVLRGSILDVAVDLRHGSPSYGDYVSAVISAREGNQILVPIGFAHGFCTLEPDTEVFYKVSAPYSPAHDRGVSWIDKDIAIDWPVKPADAVLSAKDLALPPLAGLPDRFMPPQ